ncbi:TetR family transcriptional regulator [Nocardia sp. CDC159]|uniref:TetR family transcriptional regulator n=1 Tax=Nocardia pulmonis TaxID=2951408 RepID=A0A9X2E203_9NOCA|nr:MULTISPECIES: TetR family transcriptional regulator [Nocardia]MCM6772769.1 TetR family transcriptional regulator [Nocardia pulmonis]MCM6785928.1 TetR family transcriptional regulator [Nocardia sp. CDC159]
MEAETARERLIVAAERLIAERGAAVPLRDIAAAAGQRNNSAIQYHFGSRDRLIAAVVEHRMATLEVRRLELVAERTGDGVHELLAALVVPMFELRARYGIGHYARFLEQIRTHPSLTDAANLDDAGRTSVRVIMGGLERALAELPPRLRVRRLRGLPTMLFALLADHERAVESGRVAAADDTAWTEIVDMLAGALTAPVTQRAVSR